MCIRDRHLAAQLHQERRVDQPVATNATFIAFQRGHGLPPGFLDDGYAGAGPDAAGPGGDHGSGIGIGFDASGRLDTDRWPDDAPHQSDVGRGCPARPKACLLYTSRCV